MPAELFLISDRPDDFRFIQQACASQQIRLERGMKPELIQDFLKKNNKAIVVWDAENAFIYRRIEPILKQFSSPLRLFALVDKPIHTTTYGIKYPIFGHYLMRNQESLSTELYAKLLTASLGLNAHGIGRFFPPEADIRTLMIKHTSHKKAAIDALQNVLKKRGVIDRIASLVAQSADELILNAIFDAPTDRNGNKLRSIDKKRTDFELAGREQVEVKMVSCETFMGVCVIDQFGSLTRSSILDSINRVIKDGTDATSSKLGLSRVLQSGISMLYSVNSNSSTEAMLFFKLTQSYKEFKQSFHFLSTMMS